jgi:hypothetical protein
MGRYGKVAWLAGLAAVITAVFAPTAMATTPLTISKTATGHWTRTFEWTIDKSVTPDSHSLQTGQSGTSTYTVAVTKSAGTDSIWVDGEVCVTNNGDIATENLTVVDRVVAFHDGGQQTLIKLTELDVSSNPVLDPGESACYPYSFPLTPYPGATGYQNEARATITNDPREPGEPLGPGADAPFTLPASPTLVNDTVNVNDTNGMSWPFSASGSQTYTRTFTCDEDEGTHNNTATIVETGQSDSASVTVTCTPPPPAGCTLTQGYWKTHSTYGPASKPDATWNLIGGPDTAFFSSGKSWYQLFWTAPKGKAYIILAHQYMAATLNQLAGAASTPQVDAALAWATTFFGTYTPSSSLSTAVKNQAIAYADVLDDYNNGLIGPGHCGDSDSSDS